MDEAGTSRLTRLAEDYQKVTGEAFQYFYCPILFEDSPVSLCKGHIINQGIETHDRKWTIQRTDVDGFYGSAFESDFLLLQTRGVVTPLDALAEGTLGRQLGAHVTFRGEKVEHYRASGPVPIGHTPISIETTGQTVHLVLKMDPTELLDARDAEWDVVIERDLRVQSLASVLKAAHLTLFHLVGYQYALSAAGHFVGKTILGNFFLENRGKSKAGILENASKHFGEFRNMVRPLLEVPDDLVGTVRDGRLFICKTDAWPWAMLVFVRTGSSAHAVLIPIYENEHAIARYLRFMKDPEAEFDAHLTRFEGDRWEVSKTTRRFEWPEARFTD
jgi:hypothetical protein